MPQSSQKTGWSIETVGALCSAAAIGIGVGMKAFRGSSQSSVDEDYPAHLKHQILAGTPQSTDKNSFTMEDLQSLADHYKEEITVQIKACDWDRVRWHSQTVQLVENIMKMQHALNSAAKEGDCATISSLNPKVRKAQQELRRRQEESETYVDKLPSPTSSNVNMNNQGELSRDEVRDLIQLVDSNMSNIDTTAPGGLSEWRDLRSRKRLYEDVLRTYEDIEDAEIAGDMDELGRLQVLMNGLQENIIGLPAPTQSQKRGLFEGIKDSIKSRVPTSLSTRARRSSPPSATVAAKDKASTPRKRKAAPSFSVKAGKPKRPSGRSPKSSLAEGSLPVAEAGILSFRPNWDLPCQNLLPWEVEAEKPASKDDLSDQALAFSAPKGYLSTPRLSMPTFAGLNEGTIMAFIQSARVDKSRTNESLLYLLPEECDLNEDQARHLFRNFCDEVIPDPSKNDICLTRRELDIMVFCKRRCDLGIEVCEKLMSYRRIQDIKNMWEHLFQRNGTEIILDSEMSRSYDEDLRPKIGLLAQLEGLVATTKTSRGRAILPPPNFAAEVYSCGIKPTESLSLKKRAKNDSPQSETVSLSDDDTVISNLGSSQEAAKKKRAKPKLIAADPTFLEGTELKAGTIVKDQDHHLFYIALDNETVAQVSEKLASSNVELEGAGFEIQQPFDLAALVSVNAAKYDRRSLKPNVHLAEGTLLVIPPHEWPIISRTDSVVDDDRKCDTCGSAGEENLLLLCDASSCSTARHTKCCNPPLESVPVGTWYCSDKCKSAVVSGTGSS